MKILNRILLREFRRKSKEIDYLEERISALTEDCKQVEAGALLDLFEMQTDETELREIFSKGIREKITELEKKKRKLIKDLCEEC